MAFYVEMLHHYFVFKHQAEEQEMRQRRWQFISNNLSTLTFGPVQAITGSAISENVSKHVTTHELGAFW